MNEAVLRVEALNVGYGASPVLHDISLEVYPGEIVALIGGNGAGKSTLLMTLFAQPRAWSGRVLFAGQDISTAATHQIARMGMAQAPEGRRVFAGMTVRENLLLGALGGVDAQVWQAVMSLFPRLKEREQQRAGTLSGGEQQMLASGRALMSKPKLLLLDEPSLGLAPRLMRQIFAALAEIARLGTPVFLVEQNAHQALRLAHRAYVLAQGRITQTGTGTDLLHDPAVRHAYLGITE